MDVLLVLLLFKLQIAEFLWLELFCRHSCSSLLLNLILFLLSICLRFNCISLILLWFAILLSLVNDAEESDCERQAEYSLQCVKKLPCRWIVLKILDQWQCDENFSRYERGCHQGSQDNDPEVGCEDDEHSLLQYFFHIMAILAHFLLIVADRIGTIRSLLSKKPQTPENYDLINECQYFKENERDFAAKHDKEFDIICI